MKVRGENADLINFYLKQGHKLTKTQRHSFGGKKSTVVCLSNVFLQEWEENSPRSHHYSFLLFPNVTVSLTLYFVWTVLPYQFWDSLEEAHENMECWPSREEKDEQLQQDEALHIHTALKSSCFYEKRIRRTWGRARKFDICPPL